MTSAGFLCVPQTAELLALLTYDDGRATGHLPGPGGDVCIRTAPGAWDQPWIGPKILIGTHVDERWGARGAG
jgi:hypothetical protein